MNPDQNQRQYWQGNGNGYGYGHNYGGYSSGYGQQYQRGHGAHPGQEEYGRHYNGASQGRVDPRSPHGQYPPRHSCGATSTYRPGHQQTLPRRPDPVRTTPHSRPDPVRTTPHRRPGGLVTPNRTVTPKSKPYGPNMPNKTTPLTQGRRHSITPKFQSRPVGPSTPKPCGPSIPNKSTTPKAQGKLFGQKPISRSPMVQGGSSSTNQITPKEPLPTADPKPVSPPNEKPLEEEDRLNNTYTVLDSDEETKTTTAPIPEIQITTVEINSSPENLKSEETNIEEVLEEVMVVESEEIVNDVGFEKHMAEELEEAKPESLEEAKPELHEKAKSEVLEEVKLDLEQPKSEEVESELSEVAELAVSEEVLEEVAKSEEVLEEVAKSEEVLEEVAKSEEVLEEVAKSEEVLEEVAKSEEVLEEAKPEELQKAIIEEAKPELLEQAKSELIEEDKSNEFQQATSEDLCELAQSDEVESERLEEVTTKEPLMENATEDDESQTPKKEHDVLTEKLEKLTIKSTPLKSARKSRGVLLDSTNIVESSSIKFIVRGKNDSEVLVTPVRRSNRKRVQTPAKTDEAVTLAGLGPDVHVLPNKFLQID